MNPNLAMRWVVLQKFSKTNRPNGHEAKQFIYFLGRKFPGPIELVKHHATHLDGFLTLARFPLDRLSGDTPVVLQGVRAADLEEKLRLKAMEMGLKVSLCYLNKRSCFNFAFLRFSHGVPLCLINFSLQKTTHAEVTCLVAND